MFDVVIVGAGVTGGLIARELSAYNLKVCIVEAENDVSRGSSGANSSIVHAGFDAKPGTLKARMNVLGSEMMESTAEALGVKYKRNGSLVVAFLPEDRQTLEELYERGLQNGVKELRIIGKEELHEMEPGLSDDAYAALFAPTGALVCPYELTIAAVGNAMDNGVELKLNYRVRDLKYHGEGENGYFEVVPEEGEPVEAKYVVNCAGLYSDEIARMAGDDSFTVTPRRGEYIILDKNLGDFCTHTIFRTPGPMGKGILITPIVDGNTLLGPTSENITDKEDKSTTGHGINTVRALVKQEMPGIDFSNIVSTFCGLRACGSTGDFIINNPREHFINVAGIESPGLSSSPAIAKYVVELLGKAGLDLELKPEGTYSLRRRSMHWFKLLTTEEKNEIIRQDPAFGRMACRCEEVTEGEINWAISQNPVPNDLDGVKRRTRAQMGRCQGGFCSPVVWERIADKLKVSHLAVTKHGHGSYVCSGRTKEEAAAEVLRRMAEEAAAAAGENKETLTGER